jgi:hypothetical protein
VSGRGAPVGASKGALNAQLERKLDDSRPRRSWARRVFALLPGVITIFCGLMLLGGLLFLIDTGDLEAGLWIMGIFGVLTPIFGWLTWRWGRGMPPAKFMATVEEQGDPELWDDD